MSGRYTDAVLLVKSDHMAQGGAADGVRDGVSWPAFAWLPSGPQPAGLTGSRRFHTALAELVLLKLRAVTLGWERHGTAAAIVSKYSDGLALIASDLVGDTAARASHR